MKSYWQTEHVGHANRIQRSSLNMNAVTGVIMTRQCWQMDHANYVPNSQGSNLKYNAHQMSVMLTRYYKKMALAKLMMDRVR